MINIRHAKAQDCSTCAQLSRIDELAPAAGGYISADYFKLFVGKKDLFFVAEDDKKIVGYILGEPMRGKVAHLGLLTVSRSQRGKGIGKMLLNRFRDECDKRGLDYLLLYAPKKNKSTLRFYKNMGLEQGKEYVAFAEIRR